MFILGNHAKSLVPVVSTCLVNSVEHVFAPSEREAIQKTVQTRGFDMIELSGKPSFATTALAIAHHLRDWHAGTEAVVSVAMPAAEGNSYGVPAGIVFSFPCICRGGEWTVVDHPIDQQEQDMVQLTIKDLIEEMAQ